MEKQYFVLDLKDDAATIDAYKKWHMAGAVPEPVTKSIRGADIEELEIFLAGNRLVMILTPGPHYDSEAKATADETNPDVQKWETLMWGFQKQLPFARPDQKWVPMERIYALSQQ
jgi:L-rhamnose mutarotase